MSKPIYHAMSSVKRYGGVVEDYIEIHNLMDSSKSAIADNRHRALTHNSWFVGVIIEKIFGVTMTNSDGRIFSTRQIAEEHCLEDFNNRFIPSASDYLNNMEWEEWMDNGRTSHPPSFTKIDKYERKTPKVTRQVVTFAKD